MTAMDCSKGESKGWGGLAFDLMTKAIDWFERKGKSRFDEEVRLLICTEAIIFVFWTIIPFQIVAVWNIQHYRFERRGMLYCSKPFVTVFVRCSASIRSAYPHNPPLMIKTGDIDKLRSRASIVQAC